MGRPSDRIDKVGWRRRGEGDAYVRARMEKGQFHRMKEMTLRTNAQMTVFFHISVELVPNDGTAERDRVQANLMHPSCLDLKRDERDGAAFRENLPMRNGA